MLIMNVSKLLIKKVLGNSYKFPGKSVRFVYQKTLQDPGRVKTLLDKSVPPELYKSVLDDPSIKNSGKNWISYGFDNIDEDCDRRQYHTVLFTQVTMLFIGLGFLIYYLPDHNDEEWVMREARLCLEYREKNNLPLIDPDYVPRERVLSSLPDDSEIDKIVL